MLESFDPALGRRALSAVVLAAVVVAGLFAGGWAFGALVLVCVGLLAREWATMCGRRWGRRAAAVAGVAALVVPAAAVVAALSGAVGYALAVLGIGAVIAASTGLLLGAPARWTAFGVVYLGLPALAFVWLRTEPASGLMLLLWLLAVVWATDIAAYAVGRGVGGPRLAPRISPGKTWSGLCGGIAGAAVAGAVGAALIDSGRVLAAGLLGAALAVLGQLGDLGESFLKRRAGVKDSGSIIPGHGGALDRLDSLLATAPALALLVLLRGQGNLPWQ